MLRQIAQKQTLKPKAELNLIYQKFLSEFTFPDGSPLPTPENYQPCSFVDKKASYVNENLQECFHFIRTALHALQKAKDEYASRKPVVLHFVF